MNVESLFGGETFAVPITSEHVLAGKQSAELRVVEVLPLVLPVHHNMQEGPQRRTSFLTAAIVEITLGDTFVGFNHVLHAVGEDVVILCLGSKHLLGKDRMRVMEYAPEETEDESLRNAITKTTGEHLLAAVLEVPALLKVAMLNQKLRVALFHAHAAPDFRDEQADIVIDPDIRTNIPGGRDEYVVPRQQQRDQRVVQVDDRGKRVEWPLRQRSLGAGTRGGRRFARHAANKSHEQLGQFLIMNRVEHRQRANRWIGFWWIVAAPGQDGIHGGEKWLTRRYPAAQS